MFWRKAYSELLRWKDTGENKALLVDGARQIGKTFLVEEFARKEFADWLKIDFLRDNEAVSIAQAHSVDSLIAQLSVLAGRSLEKRTTLIFLDEVQEAPNLVTFSKYLVQDPRFRLIMSGSLLGVELNRVKSWPVGYMSFCDMYPMDFHEFARSQGVSSSLWERLQEHFESGEPVEAGLHHQMINLFRLYLVVGGMPEAVARYQEAERDLGAVREVLSELHRLYRDDISKHAGERRIPVQAIYDALPSQLNKENKRFQLQALKKAGRYERYANDFAWLVAAGAALKAVNVTEPKEPLKRTEEQARFKLYASDVGMLMAQYPAMTALGALNGNKNLNFGAVYENVVAQAFTAARVPLRYCRRTGMGEVDFIAESVEGGVVPIEVKSGKTYKRHVALDNLLRSAEYDVRYAYILSEGNLEVAERYGKSVYYVPLYMLPFVGHKLASGELSISAELERLGHVRDSLIVPPPDFSQFE